MYGSDEYHETKVREFLDEIERLWDELEPEQADIIDKMMKRHTDDLKTNYASPAFPLSALCAIQNKSRNELNQYRSQLADREHQLQLQAMRAQQIGRSMFGGIFGK